MKISEFCLLNGTSLKKNEGEGGYLYLDTANITNGVVDSFQKYSSYADLPSRARRKVANNSIVYSTVRPNQQHFGIITNPPDNLIVSTGFCVIDVDEKIANPRYVYYYLSQDSITKKLHAIAEQATTAYPSIKAKDLGDLEIELPDLDRQNEVAKILSSLDEKIVLNSAINYNLQEQARSLFKAWFVDYIPFGGSKPANWKAGKLKDILLLKRNAIKPGENTELNYLPIDAIPMNTFAVSEVRPNNEAQSSLITFNRDDIIIGAMRIYFHRVIIAPFDGITRTTCFTLCSRSKEYLAFNLLCCDQDSTIEYAQATSRGSTMPYAVWDGGLGEMMIEIPDKAIALEFNEIVLPIIRTIQSSFLENKRLQELRDGLLPRLITGELDVSGLEL